MNKQRHELLGGTSEVQKREGERDKIKPRKNKMESDLGKKKIDR